MTPRAIEMLPVKGNSLFDVILITKRNDGSRTTKSSITESVFSQGGSLALPQNKSRWLCGPDYFNTGSSLAAGYIRSGVATPL